MKTSTLVILGVLGYLLYKHNQTQLFYGPPAPVMGPPAPSSDPCNGTSPNYNPDVCAQAGRTVYYPMD